MQPVNENIGLSATRHIWYRQTWSRHMCKRNFFFMLRLFKSSNSSNALRNWREFAANCNVYVVCCKTFGHDFIIFHFIQKVGRAISHLFDSLQAIMTSLYVECNEMPFFPRSVPLFWSSKRIVAMRRQGFDFLSQLLFVVVLGENIRLWLIEPSDIVRRSADGCHRHP